ncbi:phospho-N-acetylmuramoyl-pentapeptide-transferase [Leptolyngbya sp. PCC 6406]|uniref:phospho-N-acetylmuramoyl-pentapeptide- transferase n=1 Tax=Leptolyngbya sp. PCC 6406 TaxID=1173264 RepID=UPI0002AC077F|nr:phospho-N-acetylmuramoyl-pentapeptide-transferase [Leptolyngbya sp. PCC 6406]
MDAKFSSTRPINNTVISGQTLLAWVGGGLLLLALGLDALWGRLGQITSLTLPWVGAAAITAAAGYGVVPLLRSLKAGQFIREDGPQAHLKKAGTPTMGGIFLIPAGVLVGVLVGGAQPLVLAAALLTLSYGFIGWLDDWQVLRRKSNKGISPRTKLGLQIVFAALFCLWVLLTQSSTLTTVALPLGLALPLGALFWPMAGFVLVAESNATNLTDGLDGLMGGTGAIALLGLGAIVAPTHPELMGFCAALSGACIGFLVHNRNPAKVFMGDTGSLALGGALAAVGILTGQLFPLLILTLLFFAETLSVIIQVTYYKATKGPDGIGKRFFRMSPLHHHFELSGWSEVRVVATFYAVTAVLALMVIFPLSPA